MRITGIVFAVLMAVSLLVMPLAGCNGTATPTETSPATTPAETTTTTPTETHTPDFATIEASLLGQTVTFDISGSAQLWNPISAATDDGEITLDIEVGAFAMDADQNAIKSLDVTLVDSPPAGSDEGTTLIADAYKFSPAGTVLSPPAVLVWKYDLADAEALGLTEEDIKLVSYDAASDTWQEVRAEMDTTAKTITASVAMFKEDHVISMAAVAAAGDVIMTELGVELVYITDPIATNAIIEVVLRTVPGATVMLQPVNPKTETRSAWPKEADGGKIKVADEKGEVSYSWELYRQTARGEGTFEIIATTSTDPAILGQINANMDRRDIEALADAYEDVIFVEIPFTVAISDY